MLGYRTGRAAALLLAGLFAGQAGADILYTSDPSKDCGASMVDVILIVNWLNGTYVNTYANICTNPNALISLYAGTYTYCKGQEIEESFKTYRHYCQVHGHVELVEPETFAANLTKEAIAKLPVVSMLEAATQENYTSPFLCDDAWYQLQYKTISEWNNQERTHAWYIVSLYCFWCIVLGIGMIQNVVRKIVESRRGYIYVDAEGLDRKTPPSRFGVLSRAYAIVRKYATTPSALPPYHSRRIFGCTIPTRAESFIVLSFWIINLVLSGVSYTSFRGNLYFSSPSVQLWRYIADRTGYLSYGNIPLMFAFSGRNNIFIVLTGWSFGTFNIFHRHIARIATLQGIVHSIAYTGYYFYGGYGDDYRAEYKELWFALGVAATVVMSFTILFSFSYFRAKLYESFLLMHIVLSVLLLVFLWYHTTIFALKTFNYPFIVSSAVVWGFDRLMRLVRQAYINLHVRSCRGSGSMLFTDATVTYHADADLLVVDTVPANAHLFPGPGQHYYLYQPLRLLGWENHPFTLASWSTNADSGELSLQFWVRPVNGWTKALRKECERKGSSVFAATPVFSTKMLLEGPYGKREPVHCFEEVLLIAGGSGIAGVLPYLLDYARRIDSAKAAAGSDQRVPTRTRRITLVWADRREAFLRYVADGVLAKLMNNPHLCIQLYQTTLPAGASTSTASSSTEAVQQTGGSGSGSGSGGGSGGDSSSGEEKKVAAGDAAPYHIYAGRPDVLTTVEQMARSVHGVNARLAVVVCGPDTLSDAVRDVVVHNMETKRDSIEYFEESFGW